MPISAPPRGRAVGSHCPAVPTLRGGGGSVPAPPPHRLSPGRPLVPSSVQFSRSALSNSLRPHALQHARPPCLSPAPPRPIRWAPPPSLLPVSCESLPRGSLRQRSQICCHLYTEFCSFCMGLSVFTKVPDLLNASFNPQDERSQGLGSRSESGLQDAAPGTRPEPTPAWASPAETLATWDPS